MRTLLSFHVTSVDGYYEGPGQAFDWPTPAVKQDDPAVTAKMNGLAKIVISRTLDAAEWAHTQLITEDVAEAVAKLKHRRCVLMCDAPASS